MSYIRIVQVIVLLTHMLANLMHAIPPEAHRAVTNNDPASLVKLLDDGLNPNTTDLLPLAIEECHPFIVQLLLERGGDPNQRDSYQIHPIFIAIRREPMSEHDTISFHPKSEAGITSILQALIQARAVLSEHDKKMVRDEAMQYRSKAIVILLAPLFADASHNMPT